MCNAYVERPARAKATANKNIQQNVKYKYKYCKKEIGIFCNKHGEQFVLLPYMINCIYLFNLIYKRYNVIMRGFNLVEGANKQVQAINQLEMSV